MRTVLITGAVILHLVEGYRALTTLTNSVLIEELCGSAALTNGGEGSFLSAIIKILDFSNHEFIINA